MATEVEVVLLLVGSFWKANGVRGREAVVMLPKNVPPRVYIVPSY